MNIWKISISGEESGHLDDYYGLAEKATGAGVLALQVARKQVEEDRNFDDELYVSEITFIAFVEF